MLLVDTNVLLAAVDTSTPEHALCVAVLNDRVDLCLPAPVAAETAWMIESRLGPEKEATFVAAVAAGELMRTSNTPCVSRCDRSSMTT